MWEVNKPFDEFKKSEPNWMRLYLAVRVKHYHAGAPQMDVLFASYENDISELFDKSKVTEPQYDVENCYYCYLTVYEILPPEMYNVYDVAGKKFDVLYVSDNNGSVPFAVLEVFCNENRELSFLVWNYFKKQYHLIPAVDCVPMVK